MSKRVIYIFGAVVFVLLAIIGVQQYMLYQTKQYSPESTAQYTSSDVNIRVTYSRPSKKGRDIFGELVPYGQWWRTGANEPTVIEVSRDIIFEGDQRLPAGKYSLVTIPDASSWKVIFNSRIPDWGTDYYPESNVVNVSASVELLPDVVELFTIDFTEDNGRPALILAWDHTKVTVPFQIL
ncbi:DUF2911 domain-containing protein [Roseivirga sp. E12]|uniref:DUF2911 domain-containing protein n=1 Tax=Roseivirga sp. E12 TaxID=2819237 RepID=UPI001ABD135A|nr:DUF2911 domain-containing protein [Roseivirga sp. E12]MBO3698857.1 DUF2911 domain-containing protein [Roseivirga sp. E12]